MSIKTLNVGVLVIELILVIQSSSEGPTVLTEYGAVSGTFFKTSRGRTVSAFLGVPYAKPPVAHLRFLEPQRPEKWQGLRPAHKFGPMCIQYTYYKLQQDPITGDEDCLYLNIYTPTVSSAANLDVIFYIHGGAFMFGSGQLFTPDYILDRTDVVFVTVNYRLGIFGFLSTEDEVVPGNNGLKDQVLALKWVQNNINKFGGNKDRVTLAGLSAGGASVHFHYLSPQSRNLFHQGISLSGSALCPWVLSENARPKAEHLARSVNCPTNSSDTLIECLREKQAKALLSETESLYLPWMFNPIAPFGPIIEKPSRTAYLDRNPFELIREGNVKNAPWLTSMTSEEGLYPAAAFIFNDTLLHELNENWETVASHLLDYNHTVPHQCFEEYSTRIKQFYLKGQDINKNTKNELVKMIGDRLYNVDIERAARLQASVTTSPVYFYTFAYQGKYGLTEILCRCKDKLGVSHGDDLTYILKTGFDLLNPLETDEDIAMVDLMINVWTSFIKSGVPSVGSDRAWTPVSRTSWNEGNLTYLLISSSQDTKLSSSEDLSNQRFWNSLHFDEAWNEEL